MDIIGSEIHRLDRVVQILVDFTRPRDLRLEDVDLRKILKRYRVAGRARCRASWRARRVLRIANCNELPGEDDALMVRVDSDLMKQAILESGDQRRAVHEREER